MSTVSIAIDGPVASGKTVVGRALAKRLGYGFLDTGLMYRAVTWAALQGNVSVNDGDALAALARAVTLRHETGAADPATRVLVSGEDVTASLRLPEVDAGVSAVAAVPAVRSVLVDMQRAFARGNSVVMVGRDIATVVLPNADLKVFITATPEERARRRHLELAGSGSQSSYNAVLEDTRRRDRMDSERPVSPLRPAKGALVVNTDRVPVEDVVERIVAELKKKVPRA